MNCRHCNHVLWNLPAPASGAARVCPECGTGYTVASYEFVPGQVEFHCPQCDQAYYGTSAQGHLEPPEFQCSRCGTDVTMERCALRPVGGVGATGAMLQLPLPWTEPGSLPARWWNTVVAGVKFPSRIPAMIGDRDLFGSAVAFLALHVVVSSVVTIATGLAMVLFSALMVGAAGGGGPFAPPAFPGPSIAVQVGLQLAQVAIAPISMICVACAGAGMTSLIGNSFGLTFRRAFSIVAFSSGGFAFSLIPFCGALVGLVVWAVGSSIAIGAACPRGKAAGPIILGLVGTLLAYGVFSVVGIVLSALLAL